jgi:hypothetical protein
MTPQRIQWQTLELSVWQEKRENWIAVTETALKALGVDSLKRIGFKVVSFIPLQMSHAEMSQLMFGSYLMPSAELEQVFAEPTDPLLQVTGKQAGLDYQLVLTPTNRRQTSEGFLSMPNLELLLENRFLDTGVKEFHDRVTDDDSLLFDIDLSKKDVPTSVMKEFATESLATADKIADACVSRLLAKPLGKER